jgi:hypothetical protein
MDRKQVWYHCVVRLVSHYATEHWSHDLGDSELRDAGHVLLVLFFLCSTIPWAHTAMQEAR